MQQKRVSVGALAALTKKVCPSELSPTSSTPHFPRVHSRITFPIIISSETHVPPPRIKPLGLRGFNFLRRGAETKHHKACAVIAGKAVITVTSSSVGTSHKEKKGRQEDIILD